MADAPLSTAAPPSISRRNLAILITDILLFILLLNVLPFDTNANRGLAILAFIGILWLTEALHVTITALLVPLIAVGTGLMDVNTGLRSFANPIIFLFFGGFALATALHIQGLDKLIANRLLLAAKGQLMVAVLMLFGATALVSMWISNTATTAMMLPLALGVIGNLNLERERNTYVFILLGIAYSASIGGLGTLVGSPPNAIAAAQLGLDFVGWMKYGTPAMIILMPLMVATLYVILRPNLKHHFDIELEQLPWTAARRITIGIFGMTVIGWIFSSQLSQMLGGVKQFDTLVALSAVVLIGISGVASWRQIQQKYRMGGIAAIWWGLDVKCYSARFRCQRRHGTRHCLHFWCLSLVYYYSGSSDFYHLPNRTYQ